MDTLHPAIGLAARKRRHKTSFPDIVVLHDVAYPDSDENELFNIDLAVEVATLLSDVYPHVETLPFRKKSLDYLSRKQEAGDHVVVVNLVENVQRRSEWIYRVPKALEERGIPYTGCSSQVIRGTDTDKMLCKKLLEEAGLPTPRAYSARDFEKRDGIKGAHIVKSAWYHGSYGIFDDSVSDDYGILSALLKSRRTEYGGEWYAEEYIKGREFYIGMLGRQNVAPELLPLAEVVFGGVRKDKPFLSYEAKWEETGVKFVNDVTLKNRSLQKRMEDIASACWLRFGLNGYARIDFRVDEHDNPYVLEVNTNPYIGLQDSPLLRAAACQGYTPLDVLMRLISCAHRPAHSLV